jgi:hypothetical protein
MMEEGMRQEVQEFLALGPLPSETAPPERIKQYEDALTRIISPLSNEEAKALTGSFGVDECYGLGWTLLHLIETAPGWPIKECLQGEGIWIERLRIGAQNMSGLS